LIVWYDFGQIGEKMLINTEKAKEILEKGGNVIIPTETVYGLSASIFQKNAIDNIYHLKKRPPKNPLIVHAHNIETILALVGDVPKSFFKLAEAFWPGPLTMILKAKPGLNPVITANLPTVGVRIPRHEETLELLKLVGPLAAPSANLSGKPSGTKVSHLENDFGKNFPILEGKEPSCGVESTIIGWIDDSWQMLRYGFLEKESIEEVLGETVSDSNLKICPGTQFKHYSPDATLISGFGVKNFEALIGFENRTYNVNDKPFYSLGDDRNPIEIANNLYAILRKIDEDGIKNAWIDNNLPRKGLYLTILERITRAIQA
jgi:L-threonylcarbamoyladenylate synthase